MKARRVLIMALIVVLGACFDTSAVTTLTPAEVAGTYVGVKRCKGILAYEGVKPDYDVKRDPSTAIVEVDGDTITVSPEQAAHAGRWIQDPKKPNKITFGVHWRGYPLSPADFIAVYRGEVVKKGNGSLILTATGIRHNANGHNEHSTCTWKYTKAAE